MEIIAIIPARGGSKGIPRKNLIPFGGKPLLAWSIEAALAAKRVDRVAVSTDDAEIAQVARTFGAEVIERPAEISGDAAPTESALVHALDHLESAEGYRPDLMMLLQATSPIRRPGDLDGAVETLLAEGADSLFSAGPVEGFVWRIAPGVVEAVNYDHHNRPRRQDLTEHIVMENGSIYLFKPAILRQHNSRLGGRVAVFMQTPLESGQIDEPSDLPLLEHLLKAPTGAGAPGGSTP